MNKKTRPWDSIYQELGITEPPFDEKPLSVYVQEHALTIPDFPALRYLNKEITYKEIDTLASQLANVLVSLGVGKNDVVGFHMPNTPQYILGFLAVAKIGCAGSGVSPMLTPSELAYQINDANISVLISLDALVNSSVVGMADKVPTCLNTVLVTGGADFLAPQALTIPELANVQILSLLSQMDMASDQFEQRDVHWNDTYLIQYTGGTTGAPKGAMLSVRSLLRCPEVQYIYKPMEAGKDTSLTPFPMFHIAGASGAISALRYGGTSILVPDPRDIDYICEQMLIKPPEYFGAVPALHQMLLANEKFHQVDFSRLKLAITGAAPLSDDDHRRVEAVIGKGKLCDAFGMTETAPVYIMSPPQRLKKGTLGIPVIGADVAIVDVETGTKEMPIGEPGEIITSGPHVMKGYLNLPEESAKAIREFEGKSWMYTGDVGFMDDEGYVTISDRAKDMLIVGGYKVFSVEVENKLNDIDFIQSSAIIGAPDQKRQGNDIVHLFVELTPNAKAEIADKEAEFRDDIINYCREQLSPYKVPKEVHFVDVIPLTNVGKIDKKALRAQIA